RSAPARPCDGRWRSSRTTSSIAPTSRNSVDFDSAVKPKRNTNVRTSRAAAEMAPQPRRWASRRRVAAVLFLVLTALYFCNFRLRGAGDSLPTRVLPFSILREGDLD